MLSLLSHLSSIKLSHITPSFIILQQHWLEIPGCSSNSLHFNPIPQLSFKSSFINISSNHLTSLPSGLFSQLTLLEVLFPSIHPHFINHSMSFTDLSSNSLTYLDLGNTTPSNLFVHHLTHLIIPLMFFIETFNLIILYPSIITQLSSQIRHSE